MTNSLLYLLERIQKSFEGKLVGADRAKDLAVLKVSCILTNAVLSRKKYSTSNIAIVHPYLISRYAIINKRIGDEDNYQAFLISIILASCSLPIDRKGNLEFS